MWHYMRFCDIVIIWQLLTKTYHCQICIISFKFCFQAEFATFQKRQRKDRKFKASLKPVLVLLWYISYSCQMFANEIYSSRYLLCREDKIPRIRKIQISLRKLQRVRNWLPIQCEQYCSSQGLLFVKQNYKNKRSTNTDCQCQYKYKYIVVKIQLVRIITNGCLYLVN